MLILGAGPTGLGAAYRLQELGCEDFLVIEADDHPGGLASSVTDAQGFTWDLGGHVHFSHYRYYDDVLERALNDRWLIHERASWIWFRGRFVPYPFQSNLHRLHPADRDRALAGLEHAQRRQDDTPRPEHFDEWIEWAFGDGIAELFMRPYNRKVWASPLETLSCDWIGERVAVPSVEQVKTAVRLGKDDVSWGPNARFRFPLSGGTGAIWREVARLLAPGRIRLRSTAARIDLTRREVTLEKGNRLDFDTLVSTIPLDRLVEIADPLPAAVRSVGTSLRHSSVHLVGVGLRGHQPVHLKGKYWIYFPEAKSPYHRVTVFSHYSPNNVPRGRGYWSLLAETAEPPGGRARVRDVVDRTKSALVRDRLVDPRSEIVSLWHRRLEHGYPTPFLHRDRCLRAIMPPLERARVFSRGRFGGWKYEVSNQDHSFMQGAELISFLVTGEPEVTFPNPALVNELSAPRRH